MAQDKSRIDLDAMVRSYIHWLNRLEDYKKEHINAKKSARKKSIRFAIGYLLFWIVVGVILYWLPYWI